MSLANFDKVIKDSLKKSGYNLNDIDFLAPLHMKRSFYEELLKRYNLSRKQSYYLENYGHLQAADAFVILSKARENNLLRDGDLVVMLGAGTGYTWGAASVKWGVCKEL